MIKFEVSVYFVDPVEKTIYYRISGESPEAAIENAIRHHKNFLDPRDIEIGDCLVLQSENNEPIYYILNKPKDDQDPVGGVQPLRVTKAEFDFWRELVSNNPVRKGGIDAVYTTGAKNGHQEHAEVDRGCDNSRV